MLQIISFAEENFSVSLFGGTRSSTDFGQQG